MNEESRKSAYLLSRRPSQVFPESTKNMVTSSGKCCLFIMALAITLLIIGYWTEGAATPNGELRQWYGAELCSAPGSSFAVKDRSTFDAFVLRPSAGWEPGSACPVEVGSGEATTSPPVEVALEASDGWRAGGMYKPLFALPSGSYASIAIEVVDANGGTVFETGVYNLGPDDAYPWQAPSEDMMPAAAQTAEQLACACSDACVYSQDGVCDDGGEGAEYNTCGVQGIDCTDCGSRCDIDDEDDSDDDVASPPSTSRRLLFGASGGELGVADYGEQEEVAAAAAMESEAGGLDGATGQSHARGGRRLLKGGSAGGGAIGGGGRAGGGGRTATTGAAAWGTARPTRVSSAGKAAAISSASGRSYGGRTTYVAGGRSYYGGGRPYSYMYGRRAIFFGSALFVVGYGGHGCYSCVGARRNCQSCDQCGTREQCGAVSTSVVSTNLDRYELDITLTVPPEGSDLWPLTLRIHNATAFAARSADGATTLREPSMFLNFFTSDGDGYEAAAGNCLPFGWLLAIGSGLALYCYRRSYFPDREDEGPRNYGGQFAQRGARTAPVHGVHPDEHMPYRAQFGRSLAQPVAPDNVLPAGASTTVPIARAVAATPSGVAPPVVEGRPVAYPAGGVEMRAYPR